jgi:hypothetical protein
VDLVDDQEGAVVASPISYLVVDQDEAAPAGPILARRRTGAPRCPPRVELSRLTAPIARISSREARRPWSPRSALVDGVRRRGAAAAVLDHSVRQRVAAEDRAPCS